LRAAYSDCGCNLGALAQQEMEVKKNL
jgi:hypothetical protein